MDESATKVLELNGGDADTVLRFKPRTLISVTGYDTSLPEDDIKRALSKHFGSCGEISNVDLSFPDSGAILTILGEGGEEKALELSGSDVGGCKIVAKPTIDRTKRRPSHPNHVHGITLPDWFRAMMAAKTTTVE